MSWSNQIRNFTNQSKWLENEFSCVNENYDLLNNSENQAGILGGPAKI